MDIASQSAVAFSVFPLPPGPSKVCDSDNTTFLGASACDDSIVATLKLDVDGVYFGLKSVSYLFIQTHKGRLYALAGQMEYSLILQS